MSEAAVNNTGGELSYEEVLKKNGSLVFAPGGTSMLPLLRHHENTVFLVPVTEKLKRGDIILYKRADGQYVLHRIVKCKKNSYVLCGDNQSTLEYGVTDSMIIARMEGFYKGETYISLSSPEIMSYSKNRLKSLPKRRLKTFAARVYRKIFKKKQK